MSNLNKHSEAVNVFLSWVVEVCFVFLAGSTFCLEFHYIPHGFFPPFFQMSCQCSTCLVKTCVFTWHLQCINPVLFAGLPCSNSANILKLWLMWLEGKCFLTLTLYTLLTGANSDYFLSLAEVSTLSIHCYSSLEVFFKRRQRFYSFFFIAVEIPSMNSSLHRNASSVATEGKTPVLPLQ